MKVRVLATPAATTLIVLSFGLLLLVSCGKQETRSASTGVSSPSDAAAASVSVEIAESDEGFEPRLVTIERGQLVRLTFVNKGKVIHNLRIAGPNGQFGGPGDIILGQPVVMPGQSAMIEWQAPGQPGQVIFRCDVHPDHTGVISIR